MKNLITCLTLSLLTSVAFTGNGTPDRGDCTPSAPFLFASTDECNAVILSWETIDDAESYSIYASVINDPSTAVFIGQTDSNVFVDTCGGGVFYYWVIAINDCGSSIPSNFALGSCEICNLWTVDDDGQDNPSADFDNIQDAIDAAVEGDQIVVYPGTYTSTQDGHVVNMLGKAVMLRSTDPDNPKIVAATIIDGEGTRRGIACFNNETSATLISGLTISSGFSVDYDYDGSENINWWENSGGGMYNMSSSPTVRACTFTNNSSEDEAGGIFNYYSSPNLDNCTFSNNNTAQDGGGMYNYSSSPTLQNCVFVGNTSNDEGGGIRNFSSSPSLYSCEFTNNTASTGAGMHNASSSPVVEDCTFTTNSANDQGGGMFNWSVSSTPTISNCVFTGNTASSGGGGMSNGYECSPIISNCTFANNNSSEGGGMFNNGSSPTLSYCEFSNNNSNYGGGMRVFDSSTTLVECAFISNTANIHGGAVYCQLNNLNPSFSNCIFQDNIANQDGGGMFNSSSNPELIACTFSNNSAPDGGGMYNTSSHPSLFLCDFSTNSATTDHGGGCSIIPVIPG